MNAHITKIRLALAAISSFILLTGFSQSVQVQAPYDSFVCFKRSFNQCAVSVHGLATIQPTLFANLTSSSANLQVTDADSRVGKTASTDTYVLGDAGNPQQVKYSCAYGTVPYNLALPTDKIFAVVFVSPVIISEIGQQLIKIRRARDACDRAIKLFNYQIKVLSDQDRLSNLQNILANLNADVDAELNTQERVGIASYIGQEDAAAIGLPVGTAKYIAIARAKHLLIPISNLLREHYKAQSLLVTSSQQFADVQLLITQELSELGRELFVLDRAAVVADIRSTEPTQYQNGSWVQKGTIVATTKTKGP